MDCAYNPNPAVRSARVGVELPELVEHASILMIWPQAIPDSKITKFGMLVTDP